MDSISGPRQIPEPCEDVDDLIFAEETYSISRR